MKFIVRLLKLLLALLLSVVGFFGTIAAVFAWLSQKGIIKTHWIAEKTPSGKGVRVMMSVWDKLFLSFQL